MRGPFTECGRDEQPEKEREGEGKTIQPIGKWKKSHAFINHCWVSIQ